MGERAAILVVDDDEAIRRMIVHMLRRERYDVEQAADGAEAVARMRTRPFDVMVLDLMMPVMSGPEVIAYLDTHDDAGTPRVIVVSAAGERDLARLTSASVHAKLRKPFDLAELVAAVRACEPFPAGHSPSTAPAD